MSKLEDIMNKSYNMKDLGIEALIGRKVLSASINAKNDLVVLDTDKGNLYLTWEGDCCAKCFLANINGSENLIDAKILKVENKEWDATQVDEFEVIESMGTTIKTDKGFVDLETRLEHNGYYGGEILVSDDEPMDTYHSPRYENNKLPKLKKLKDF